MHALWKLECQRNLTKAISSSPSVLQKRMSSLREQAPDTSDDASGNNTVLIIALASIAVVLIALTIIIVLRTRWHYRRIQESKRVVQRESQPYSLTTLSRYFNLEEECGGNTSSRRTSAESSQSNPPAEEMDPNKMYGSPTPPDAVFPGRPSVSSIASTSSKSSSPPHTYGVLTSMSPQAVSKRPKVKIDEEYTTMEKWSRSSADSLDKDEGYLDMRPAGQSSSSITVTIQPAQGQCNPQMTYVNVQDACQSTAAVKTEDSVSRDNCSRASPATTPNTGVERYMNFPLSPVQPDEPTRASKTSLKSSKTPELNYINVRDDKSPSSVRAMESHSGNVHSRNHDEPNRYVLFPVQSVNGQPASVNSRPQPRSSAKGDHSKIPTEPQKP